MWGLANRLIASSIASGASSSVRPTRCRSAQARAAAWTGPNARPASVSTSSYRRLPGRGRRVIVPARSSRPVTLYRLLAGIGEESAISAGRSGPEETSVRSTRVDQRVEIPSAASWARSRTVTLAVAGMANSVVAVGSCRGQRRTVAGGAATTVGGGAPGVAATV